jgi:hypothetical protein
MDTKNKVGQTPQDMSSTNIFLILPETSDSISLNNFIASITQRTSPFIVVPNFHKHSFVWRWLSIKVPIIGDFGYILVFFYSLAASVAATSNILNEAEVL